MAPEQLVCPTCGGTNTNRRGRTAICLDCKKVGRKHFFDPNAQQVVSKITYGKEDIHVIYTATELLTQEDLLKRFQIDTDVWEVDRFTVKMPQPGYRKDHEADLSWQDGRITSGHVRDSGKMLVVQFYSYEMHFLRRKNVEEVKAIIHDLLADLTKQAPRYPTIRYPKQRKKILYEIDVPDAHIGLLGWEEESGQNYDVKIAVKTYSMAIDMLLGHAAMFHVSQILMPIGHDLFNVDNAEETTTHGTRQQEDTRPLKTFRAGILLMRDIIAKCLQVAPMKIVVVQGNHDELRMEYLGEVLRGYFHNSKHVEIVNDARKRKYVEWGANLIGLTHGYWEPATKLPTLMALENRANGIWARTRYAEWHLGDKHHLKELEYRTDEGDGMTIRYLRALSPTSTWTFDKGFVGALQAATSFVWDYDNGMIGHFNAAPNYTE